MDSSLRDLERTLRATPDDEPAARAYMVALARESAGPRNPPALPSLPLPEVRDGFARSRGEQEPPPVDELRFQGDRFLGPLLHEEVARLRSLAPDALDEDAAGLVWLRSSEEAGRALFAATLTVRLLRLELIGNDAPDTFATWCALHVAIDAGGETAVDSLTRVVVRAKRQAAERAVRLLASRPEPEVGRRLARLAREAPSETRPRIYAALERGRVPLDALAKDDLRAALKRELPGTLREKAYAAIARAAKRADLERDRASGPPEMRAAAFEALLARVGVTDAHELMRLALIDHDAEVRRAAVKLLGTARWLSHPRVADWTLGRLLDADRTVRHEAIRILRRTGVPARHQERLRHIVASAPPGIRPALLRLLEQVGE